MKAGGGVEYNRCPVVRPLHDPLTGQRPFWGGTVWGGEGRNCGQQTSLKRRGEIAQDPLDVCGHDRIPHSIKPCPRSPNKEGG